MQASQFVWLVDGGVGECTNVGLGDEDKGLGGPCAFWFGCVDCIDGPVGSDKSEVLSMWLFAPLGVFLVKRFAPPRVPLRHFRLSE